MNEVIFTTVMQLYRASVAAYDMYLEARDFPSAYLQLRFGLVIERQRLQLWAREISHNEQSPQDYMLWGLFKAILVKTLAALEGGTRTMEEYEHDAGFPDMTDLSGSIREIEILETLSVPNIAPGSSRNISSIARSIKFVMRDKKRLEQLVKELCYLNDSLNKLTSSLQQESSRRRLRSYLSAEDVEQLQLLQEAAAFLEHYDIERMASTKRILTDSPRSNPLDLKSVTGAGLLDIPSDFEISGDFLSFEAPFQADQTRTLAVYRRTDGHEETVLVDWRCVRDDTWRRKNPASFQKRVDGLAKILNQDLRSLDLCVLHCVGYYHQNSMTTGYIFRPPPGASLTQYPTTLFSLFTNVQRSSDIPDLDERFEIAKGLVSTVFEFHNMGWMHKSLQSKNVLFWPSDDPRGRPNLKKPYLLGFDISRPNLPGEVSEKPMSSAEDDVYRHPSYKGSDPHSFIPPYDIYSLGILLFEIGMWRSISQGHRRSRSSSRRDVSPYDPQLIEKVATGPVADLGRHMGGKYRDAVLACLNLDFDRVWDDNAGPERMLKFQSEVQKRVVDPIASCKF
ncbi:hypothetical protein GP486_002268 [Trichoglossum hirsutum]|uniref:Protein kinase domain-containing protein n=1 Tax=Trichoglossum hirsutum TaxID=265104 RepID=A0A9P8LFJ1_9PEZI|nr:hypothetical protein GP486_002268 [Trichoglossum hirsutum]